MKVAFVALVALCHFSSAEVLASDGRGWGETELRLDPVLRESVLANDSWILNFDLGDAAPESVRVHVLANDIEIAVHDIAGRDAKFALPRDSCPEHSHISVAFRDPHDELIGVGYSYLRCQGTRLTPESFDDYIAARSTSIGGAIILKGPTDFVPEERLAKVSDALVAAHENGSAEGSCSSGGGFLGMLVPSLLLLAYSRYRRSIAVAAVFLAGLMSPYATDAHAAVAVNGYVAFWDSRLGSDLTGNRLEACNTADYSCSVNGGDCCIRGIPYVTVKLVKKDLSVVGTTLTDTNGWFQFSNLVYTSADVAVIIEYTRTGAPTSQMISSGSSIYWAAAGGYFSMPPSGTLTVPTRQTNSNGDSSSENGNLATIWHASTRSFQHLETEGEYRQRKTYGSGNSYDLIDFRYNTTVDAYSYCSQSRSYIPASFARNVKVHYLAGQQLVCRLVGPYSGGSAVPAFPPIGFSDDSQEPRSEASSLLYGIPKLMMLLSRFDPQTAAVADVKTGTGLGCFFDVLLGTDSYPNGNSAAWSINNAFALWDLIDSDTSDADDSVSDNVDTSVALLMDAFYANFQATGGSSGQNRKYEEFTQSTTPTSCSDNEDCASGESCMGFGAATVCRTGDTCGGNIGDLIYHLGFQGVTGNLANTVKSSKCMRGSPDQAYPFSGSYRDD